MDMKDKKKSKKRTIIIGCAIGLAAIGVGMFVLAAKKEKQPSFPEWLKIASKDELEETYETMRLEFCKTGLRPLGMQPISTELGHRGALEWFEKHPPNTDPNFRWTDANRWDKD